MEESDDKPSFLIYKHDYKSIRNFSDENLEVEDNDFSEKVELEKDIAKT